MAKKKVDWRRGIVLLRDRDGKPRPATEDLALRYLALAGAEKDPKRREGYRKAAQYVFVLGRANEEMVDLATFKPGRPKGVWLSTFDAPLRASMEKTVAETGEIRPYLLARLAVEANEINDDLREAAIRRLVRWWQRPDRQK